MTLSGDTSGKGRLHPLSIVADELARSFIEIGFEHASGHEIESEENNFDLLNIPKDHPARDAHDTFFIKDMPGYVMRTHISSHQVPYLRENKHRLEKGPLKMFSIGRVFRYEATDATHEVQFLYMEGVVVGKTIHMGHLKGTLEHFLKTFLKDNEIEMRLRPGYFPFVEPGVEVDLMFKGNWMEVLGAGMIHPVVLHNAGIDPAEYSGFAFGTGVDRLMMRRLGITDVRYAYQGDLRLHYSID